MIYNKQALLWFAPLTSLMSCIGFCTLLFCCHLSCQTRLYLDSPITLLLLVAITLPNLHSLVGNILSFSFNLMKFKKCVINVEVLQDSKKQRHHLEVSLRTRNGSYTNPSRAKSLLNTSLKFSMDENRTEETFLSSCSMPKSALPSRPKNIPNIWCCRLSEMGVTEHKTKSYLEYHGFCFIISHSSLLYISSKNYLHPATSKETQMPSETIKVLYRMTGGGGGGRMEVFSILSQKPTLQPPLLPKPWHVNLMQAGA